jgi:hypothetical protein
VKGLLIIAALAVGSYFAWQHFASPAPEADPVQRLSQFIDTHIDQILGPLPFEVEGRIDSPSQNHHLRMLRENFRDLQGSAMTEQKRLYETAALLCDDLLRATDERDRHIARINDTRAKSKVSPLAGNSEQHRLGQLKFFENGIALSWQETSRKLRAVIDRRYRQLRELERLL